MWQYIESEQNKYLKKVKQLQHKKFRAHFGQFVAEGVRFVKEALEKGAAIEIILVAEDQSAQMEALLADYSGTVLLVKKGLLEKVMQTVTPQGVAAIVRKPNWSTVKLTDLQAVLIIDGIQDPGNLGTIIRTALASGTEAVYLLPGTVDLYNDKVLRATMGAIFALPIMEVAEPEELLEELRMAGFATIVSDIRAKDYYDKVEYPKRTALVISNEANGPQLIRQGDYLVKIPLYGEAESLNAAIACGILLYELERWRRRG